MALIPKPQFPNVPKLPGVPQLLRSPLFPAGPPPILGAAIALGRLWQALFTQPLWAIYKQPEPAPQVNEDGVETVTVTAQRKPVVVPDSFLDFDYTNEYSVSDYPVQGGGFASYNKVANPFETFVRLSKGGSKQDRKKFLDSLDAIVGTLDLYDILTPEKTFTSVNVLRWEIHRKGNQGANFFAEVNVYFREIRTVSATYTNTSLESPTLIAFAKQASANVVQNIGTVQAQLAERLTPEGLGIPFPTV